MPLRPCTDEEWGTLSHTILTSDVDLDLTVLDCSAEECEEQFDAQTEHSEGPNFELFDEFGDYRKHRHANEQELFYFDADSYVENDLDNIVQDCVDYVQVNYATMEKKEPNFKVLRPYFNWMPTNIIKKTFQYSTQYARTPMSTILKKNYKSPFPALNVKHRDEPVATDTVYSDTPSIDDGAMSAEIFLRTKTLVTDVYPIKSDKQFVNTLEDNIQTRGAMNKLISDRA